MEYVSYPALLARQRKFDNRPGISQTLEDHQRRGDLIYSKALPPIRARRLEDARRVAAGLLPLWGDPPPGPRRRRMPAVEGRLRAKLRARTWRKQMRELAELEAWQAENMPLEDSPPEPPAPRIAVRRPDHTRSRLGG